MAASSRRWNLGVCLGRRALGIAVFWSAITGAATESHSNGTTRDQLRPAAIRAMVRRKQARLCVLSLLRSDACCRLDALDLGRAILELGDFPERVERGIGQKVGRRFHEGERNEYDAVGNGVVLAHGKLDRAAAGGDPHRIARLDAELRDRAA